MCTYSAVHDNWREQVPQRYPNVFPNKYEFNIEYATKEDIAQLRRELEEIVKVLKAAKLFDETTGQKDCGTEEKVRLLRELADVLEVDISEAI